MSGAAEVRDPSAEVNAIDPAATSSTSIITPAASDLKVPIADDVDFAENVYCPPLVGAVMFL